MTAPGWSPEARDALARWLSETLSADVVEAIIPEGDPLRTWWTADAASAVGSLTHVLFGGADHLTLLALVQRARLISPPPRELDERLSTELIQLATLARSAPVAADDSGETFLCYAHEDTERVIALQRLLTTEGVRIFRDVEHIRPGESITTRLYQVISAVRSAVTIVSHFSECSEWVSRERARLLARREGRGLLVMPVIIDDVPLPESIADLFTIDLRGYRGERDDGWARTRLRPLVRRLTAQSSNSQIRSRRGPPYEI